MPMLNPLTSKPLHGQEVPVVYAKNSVLFPKIRLRTSRDEMS